jgi:hypothetical protein
MQQTETNSEITTNKVYHNHCTVQGHVLEMRWSNSRVWVKRHREFEGAYKHYER